MQKGDIERSTTHPSTRPDEANFESVPTSSSSLLSSSLELLTTGSLVFLLFLSLPLDAAGAGAAAAAFLSFLETLPLVAGAAAAATTDLSFFPIMCVEWGVVRGVGRGWKVDVGGGRWMEDGRWREGRKDARSKIVEDKERDEVKFSAPGLTGPLRFLVRARRHKSCKVQANWEVGPTEKLR